MDFDLNEEQIDIQKAAREFAQREFDPDQALDLEKNSQFPLSIWKKACKLGFIGLHFPKKYGGQDLGLLENVLVVEEFCRRQSGVGIALGLSDFGSEMILRFGNDDQKRKHLPPIVIGDNTSSIAYIEKNQTDEFTFKTIATRDDHRYVINKIIGKI